MISPKDERSRDSRFLVLWGLGLLFLLFPIPPMSLAGEKVTVGVVEDIIVIPFGIKLPARIDTGAATSSLDAQEIKIEDGFAVFKLSPKHGGYLLRSPIVDWRHVRSSESRERRPIVEIEFCIGSKRIRTQVNLNDRSKVKYPLLIGRNTLQENFVVDCMRERCSPPSCPEVTLP